MHLNDNELWIEINLAEQQLYLRQAEEILMAVAVSSATNGPGELNGSECTPRGWHQIRAKIGTNCLENSVFRGRRPTGEIYSTALRESAPRRDWILSRILWLSGLEVGRNRLGNVDTQRRYIYLHGTPDEVELGVPGSIGCIRMRNSEIMRLFDRVPAGTRVLINE